MVEYVKYTVHKETRERGVAVGVDETYLGTPASVSGQASVMYDYILERRKRYEGGHEHVWEYSYKERPNGSLKLTVQTFSQYDYMGKLRHQVVENLETKTKVTTDYNNGRITKQVTETPTERFIKESYRPPYVIDKQAVKTAMQRAKAQQEKAIAR